MKKIIVLTLCLLVILGILYFSITNLINTEAVLYKNISTERVQNMINQKETFILYLYQKNCPACRQVMPIINDYIRNSGKDIFAIDINADDNKNYIIENLDIQGTPTLIFFDNGMETGRLISVFNESEFEKKLKENDL